MTFFETVTKNLPQRNSLFFVLCIFFFFFYRVNDVIQMAMYRKNQMSILSKLTDYKLTKFNLSELFFFLRRKS